MFISSSNYRKPQSKQLPQNTLFYIPKPNRECITDARNNTTHCTKSINSLSTTNPLFKALALNSLIHPHIVLTFIYYSHKNKKQSHSVKKDINHKSILIWSMEESSILNEFGDICIEDVSDPKEGLFHVDYRPDCINCTIYIIQF